ncbi:hypothetical protein BXA17_04130 [Acinetobacter baumannii]|nr:hypothetical protein BXA17_04130 [Acinetobacter baumannii]
MAFIFKEVQHRTVAPVIIDEDKCIADKGCTVCVDVCPMDLLAIDPTTQKAYMQFLCTRQISQNPYPIRVLPS